MINKFLQVRQQPDQEEHSLSALSRRELEILGLLAEGKSNKVIADQLCISIKTVEKHRTNIMQKLEIHNIVDLVKFAIKHGIINV